MKAIKVRDLKPGMRFDQPVYIEGENVLVPAGVALKDKDIERLTRWDIDEVFTEGSPVSDSPGAAAGPKGKAGRAWLAPGEERVFKIYRAAVDKVEAIFHDISDGTYLSHEPVDFIVKEMLDLLRQNKNESIQLILLGEWVERKLSVSAVNCMILAAVIGTTMRLASHRLLQLATSALLHDVGMLRVDREILRKEGKLSEAELAKMKAHSVTGYQIISRDMKYPEEIAQVALQHHEHWDGRGYPRGLKGEEINPFGGRRLRGDGQRTAVPQLDDRLFGDEGGAQRQRPALRSPGAQGLPGEHGRLSDRKHRAAEQRRHRTGRGEPRRGAAAAQDRAAHRRVRQPPGGQGERGSAREEEPVHRQGRRPEGRRRILTLNRRGKGEEGEARAERYLNALGYRTVARNFRTRRGEIDLVVEGGGRLAFVEVKCWDSLGAEDLQYAVGPQKQRRIREASRQFLWRNPQYGGRAVRYDVVLISGGQREIRHYESAFDGV